MKIALAQINPTVGDFAANRAKIAGLARDGGLYVPQKWPKFSAAQWRKLAGRPYAEVALEVLRPYIGAEIAPATLKALIDQSAALTGTAADDRITVNTYASTLNGGGGHDVFTITSTTNGWGFPTASGSYSTLYSGILKVMVPAPIFTREPTVASPT